MAVFMLGEVKELVVEIDGIMGRFIVGLFEIGMVGDVEDDCLELEEAIKIPKVKSRMMIRTDSR